MSMTPTTSWRLVAPRPYVASAIDLGSTMFGFTVVDHTPCLGINVAKRTTPGTSLGILT